MKQYKEATWTPRLGGHTSTAVINGQITTTEYPAGRPVSVQALTTVGRKLDYGKGRVREIILSDGTVTTVLDSEIR